MYKIVASQAKSAVAVESPYSPIYGHFRFCVFFTRETRILLRACEFFGLKLTLRLAEKLHFCACCLSYLFLPFDNEFCCCFLFHHPPIRCHSDPFVRWYSVDFYGARSWRIFSWMLKRRNQVLPYSGHTFASPK